MPSIAIFLHQLAATGVARNSVAIARYLDAQGWRVAIITVRPGGELAGETGSVRHLTLGSAGMPRAVELAVTVGRLRRAVQGLAPDILLSAGNHAHLAVMRAMRGQDMPRRVYRISNELSRPPGHGSFLRSTGLRKLGLRFVAKDADRVVLVSPVLSDPAFDRCRRDGRVRVIENGVDVAEVRRRAQEPVAYPWLDGDTPVVLAVGRLSPQKNLPRLIQAFAIAHRRRRLRLAIVGGGPTKARAALERLAREEGVVADLHFIDRVSNPFPIMRKAAVLVLPSLWEGLPNVLLEALACGTPVVASRTAGNAAQILEDGRYGVLVDPRDPAQIAKGILAQVDPERRIMGAERAAAFDRARMLERYKALFEELLPV